MASYPAMVSCNCKYGWVQGYEAKSFNAKQNGVDEVNAGLVGIVWKRFEAAAAEATSNVTDAWTAPNSSNSTLLG